MLKKILIVLAIVFSISVYGEDYYIEHEDSSVSTVITTLTKNSITIMPWSISGDFNSLVLGKGGENLYLFVSGNEVNNEFENTVINIVLYFFKSQTDADGYTFIDNKRVEKIINLNRCWFLEDGTEPNVPLFLFENYYSEDVCRAFAKNDFLLIYFYDSEGNTLDSRVLSLKGTYKNLKTVGLYK